MGLMMVSEVGVSGSTARSSKRLDRYSEITRPPSRRAPHPLAGAEPLAAVREFG